MLNLLDLISQDVTLRHVSNRDGGEWTGPCPICQGTDRFHVWPNSSRSVKFWCRQCAFRGDAIHYLREVRHLSFPEAAALVGKALPETDHARHTRERALKERILTEYWAWYHVQLITWTDRFRALAEEIETAEIGYRAVERMPALYTETERVYWVRCLARLYDERATFEHTCDILTYDSYEQERFVWWQRERS